jgi:hypothetical protein
MPANAVAHGRNAQLFVTDNFGTCRNVSGDLNNIVLTWLRDNPDATTMTYDSHQRIPGLRDATLTGAYVWNGAETTAVPQVLDGLLTGSANALVQFAPAGSITGCPLYTACMLVNSHAITAPVNGVVAGTYAFALASGSLTSGSCV